MPAIAPLHATVGNLTVDIDHVGAAIFLDDERVGSSPLPPIQDVREGHPHERRVEVTAHELDPGGVVREPLLDEREHPLADQGALFRVRESDPQGVSGTRPGRHDEAQAGLGCRVRILVEGHVDATRAGFPHEADGLLAQTPLPMPAHLVVRHLDRDVRLLADADRLAHRLEHARALVTHVGDVDAAV